ncbi:1666_t:CDS:2 [Paraglomus occultum]|uniref:1666_t:CDS:1 n=1 Tax=Paraglomus occultum TaxID=144539 RepID=A0A9N8Z2V4_9GLOM|nr:1666_t:CDS:2 [Paraglomus occultum]
MDAEDASNTHPTSAESPESQRPQHRRADRIHENLTIIPPPPHQRSESTSSAFPIAQSVPINASGFRRTRSYYSTSIPNEAVPWSALRRYNDGSFVQSPGFGDVDDYFGFGQLAYNMSPRDERGGGGFDAAADGIRQRTISDGSSRFNTITSSEQVSLLNSLDSDSDFDYNDYESSSTLEHPNCLISTYYHIKNFLKKKLYLSPSEKDVVKCALAYFLASLFTFVPALNSLCDFDRDRNSYLVAAVAVFFNPAKTLGGIFEAVFFALVGGFYGCLVGIASMACAVWFNDNDLRTLGHLVSVLWCGGTREGSVHLGVFKLDKIFQVTKIVLIGVGTSFIVAVLVWPVSASKRLKKNIEQTLDGFCLLLKLLTKAFLIDNVNYTDESVQRAITSHRATFTSLITSLAQARLEIHNRGMQRRFGLYEEAVQVLQRLAQHLSSLRSCCGIELEMIKDMGNHDPKPTVPLTPTRTSGVRFEDGNMHRRPTAPTEEEEEYGDITILLEFIQCVGPHLKSLAYTCKRTMKDLEGQFSEKRRQSEGPPDFNQLYQNLEAALAQFETSQSRAVTRLYKRKTIVDHYDGRANEEIFLIYFFAFNLREFSKELERLVDVFGKISDSEERVKETRRRRGWWRWLCWCCYGCIDELQELKYESKTRSHIEFPEHSHNLFDTIQTPKPKTKWQQVQLRVWKRLSWFRQFEVKYATKAAVSAAILSAPAFIDYTRETFVRYRGEWACISMMVVMAPTVGSTNLNSFYRVFGTLFGSYLAFIVTLLFPPNAAILAVIGFLIALPCFYIVLNTKYDRMGQFILLTYNLVALSYKEKNVMDIARYRAVAVGTGVLWGLLVTTYVWPYEARVELRKGLSMLFINMSWLYKKLEAVFSASPERPTNRTENLQQTNVVINSEDGHLNESAREFLDLELFLQVSLLKLYDLLNETSNEPRLKGPFPQTSYREIITSCQNILDKLLSMRIAVTKEEWYGAIRRDFIIPINKQRRELVGNVLLYYYTLAAALQLKTPLPPYLPPAEQARLMEDVIRELEKVGNIMQELFGCMGGEEFDLFFTTDATSNDVGNETGDSQGEEDNVIHAADPDTQNIQFDLDHVRNEVG